jgi:hypothetical protein
MHLLGGATKVEGLSDCKKIAKMAEFHVGILNKWGSLV